jgi:hypothetical protein
MTDVSCCNYPTINETAILNPNDPDYQIEIFWNGFKLSMFNFYHIFHMTESFKYIAEWSSNLNSLKNEKKYDDIEICIRDYISHYAFDLAKQMNSNYYDQILISNIKRWDKISNIYKFKNSKKYNKIILLFFIYNEIKLDGNGNHFQYIKSIDYVDRTNDFDTIIEYSILFNKSKILEKLRLVPDYNVIVDIKRLYPSFQFLDNNIKMNKLCLFIKRHSI